MRVIETTYQKFESLPAWVRVGVKVNYHEYEGGPVLLKDLAVKTEPYRISEDITVVELEEIKGIVPLDILSPVL